jgi:GNAT superfamily N-acetyltransferase
MHLTRDEYELTDDRSRLDLDAVAALLNDTYWAAGRSRETIARSIAHSMCFGVFHAGRQVGFARAITDRATYTYLCDVVIAPGHRGRGLGKWLVASVLAHPELQTTTYLRTRDAHGLYRGFGFAEAACMRRGESADLCLPPGAGGC